MKRAISLLAAAAILATTFAGCSGSSTPASSTGAASTTASAAGGNVELSVSTWDYANYQYQQNQVAKFMEKNPNVKVNVIESSSNDYDDKIQIMLSGGETVDVVFTKGTPALSALVAKEQIMPLDSYIASSKIDVSKFSGLIEQLQLNGKTYSIPYRKDNCLIFYNKDLFDKAGVAYPKDGMTMTQYRELAKKMTSGEGASKVYGAHIHTWASNVNQFARRTGAYDPFGKDKSVLTDYYNTILAMQNDDKSVMDYGSLKAGSVHYSGVFYNQQVAMMEMGTWFINMLVEKKVDFKWGVCSMPDVAGTGNTYAVGGVTPVGINAKAKNPEQAWNFIQYVTGEEGALELAKSGILPGYSSDAVVAEFTKLQGVPQDIGQYLTVPKLTIEMPMNAKGREVDKIITEEHDLIMTNSISAKDGLAEMQQRVNDVLGQ